MPRKACVKKDFPITTCRTKTVTRCEGWKPKEGKPKTESMKPKKTREKKQKKFNPPLGRVYTYDKETDAKLWHWYENRKGGGRGPTEKTRFPPRLYKRFPHKFTILQEGAETLPDNRL